MDTLAPAQAHWGIAEIPPDLIVYDAAAPHGALLRRWQRLRPAHTALLVVFGEHGAVPVAELLRAGADACLRRPLSLLELEARIQALLRRSVAAQRGPAAGALTVDLRAPLVSYTGRSLLLPTREHALLYLLGRVADQAVSREALWQHLWGEEDEPRPERIELYVARLRRKLARLGAPNALQTLRGFGYRLQGPVALR